MKRILIALSIFLIALTGQAQMVLPGHPGPRQRIIYGLALPMAMDFLWRWLLTVLVTE